MKWKDDGSEPEYSFPSPALLRVGTICRGEHRKQRLFEHGSEDGMDAHGAVSLGGGNSSCQALSWVGPLGLPLPASPSTPMAPCCREM